jgi:hypothetical protein
MTVGIGVFDLNILLRRSKKDVENGWKLFRFSVRLVGYAAKECPKERHETFDVSSL